MHTFKHLFIFLFFFQSIFTEKIHASLTIKPCGDQEKSKIEKHVTFTLLITPQSVQSNTTPAISFKSLGHQSVPGLPGQRDMIQAINSGNLTQFHECIQRGDDCLAENRAGHSPLHYVTELLCKSSGIRKIKGYNDITLFEMFKIMTIMKIKLEYRV